MENESIIEGFVLFLSAFRLVGFVIAFVAARTTLQYMYNSRT
jgi:hypothetical protein